MKKQALAEIKKMDIQGIKERIKYSDEEMQKLVLDKSINKLTDVKVLTRSRKDIAQISTILRQKELLNQLEERI